MVVICDITCILFDIALVPRFSSLCWRSFHSYRPKAESAFKYCPVSIYNIFIVYSKYIHSRLLKLSQRCSPLMDENFWETRMMNVIPFPSSEVEWAGTVSLPIPFPVNILMFTFLVLFTEHTVTIIRFRVCSCYSTTCTNKLKQSLRP